MEAPNTLVQGQLIGMESPDEESTIMNEENPNGQNENDIVNDDIISLTDTQIYEGDDSYEPFETYQHKVLQLASQVLPKARSIAAERLKGGFDNRTIGITVSPPPPANIFVRILRNIMDRFSTKKKDNRKQYVLRVPRIDSEFLPQQVAVLNVLGSKLSLPIAKVAAYDTSENNVLGSGYMIQTRLPGRPLKQVIADLNPRQLLCVMKGLMGVHKALFKLQSYTAGEIAEDNITIAFRSNIRMSKYYVPDRQVLWDEDSKPRTWPAARQSTLTTMIEQCDRWREYCKSEGYAYDYIWDSFTAISKTLGTLGFLDGPCSLQHGDLGDHNILVHIKDENTVKITGVIDWDYATFVPKFVAYRAPFWMWIDDEMDWEDERFAVHEPKTIKHQAVKAYFMDHASDEWKNFAFSPEAILGRQMFDFLLRGVHHDHEAKAAEALLKDWDKLHPEDQIITQDPFLDSVSEFETED